MVELPLCIIDKIMLYNSHPLSDVFKAHVEDQDLFRPHRHKVLWVNNSETQFWQPFITSDDENPEVSAMIELRVFSRTIATRFRIFYPDLSYTHRLHLLYGKVSLHINRDIIAQIKDRDMDQEYRRFYALVDDTQVDSGSEDEDDPYAEYRAFMEDGEAMWTIG